MLTALTNIRLTKVLHHGSWSSPVKGRLPSKVVSRQRSSSIKGRLPSKVLFRQRSSSVAPKNGVEFRQESIGVIRCNLATLRRRATSCDSV